MPGIDDSLTFYPLGIAVLTVSDTRTEETARSGALLVERLFLDHHPRLTPRSVGEIADAAARRFDVGSVTVVHRFGAVVLGWLDPGGGVNPVLAFPEQGVGLQPVHEEVDRLEGGATVRGGRGHEDDRLAGRDRAAAVDDAN